MKTVYPPTNTVCGGIKIIGSIRIGVAFPRTLRTIWTTMFYFLILYTYKEVGNCFGKQRSSDSRRFLGFSRTKIIIIQHCTVENTLNQKGIIKVWKDLMKYRLSIISSKKTCINCDETYLKRACSSSLPHACQN